MTTPHIPDETILDRLSRHAANFPSRLAYRFLRDAGVSDTLTFGQLHQRVFGLATQLREHAALGDRALLLYPPGLEFIEAFLACLAARVIAVPAYPPRRNRKAERLHGIMADCSPSLILTTNAVRPSIPTELAKATILATDASETSPTLHFYHFDTGRLPSETVAFLQYTSGSTGTPRGVVITHGNLTANERAIEAAFRHTQDSVVIGWLPVFHDMGLIGNILQPLFVGFPSVLLAPTSFLREPVRWLRAITEYGGTTAGAPNFAYDHCVRHITSDQKKGLDLSTWTLAYNGAEPVRGESLDRFAKEFADFGFRRRAFFPCYGLAEATLFVSGGPVGEEPRHCFVDASTLEAGQITTTVGQKGRCLTGSGTLAEKTKVVVVDPSMRQVVQDEGVGELWVSSASVAAGYWGKDKETQSTFRNYLITGEGPFLSTGDMGFLRGREVYVTGRIKDTIIINGRNIYPQDVEWAVESVLPSLGSNSCAAFGVEVGQEERLAVVVEAHREQVQAARDLIDIQEGKQNPQSSPLWGVVDKICQAILSEIEIAVHSLTFVRPGSFLRTSSGKIQRRATRASFIAGHLDIVFAWDVRNPGHLSRVCPGSTLPQLSGRI